MLFNSKTFIIFFIIVYGLYIIFRKNKSRQNLLLLVSSYVFYGAWDWRFLFLILLSTCIDFFVGRALGRTERTKPRKFLLVLSVVSNLSILGFFKYFNFFAESFVQLLNHLGMSAGYVTLHIILPIGISFYTFQTLSYTIDIYRRRITPTDNFFDFALFVSFFPQLVAGPIERARHLLPQIERSREITLEQVDAAIFLILWGYFKKVVVADNIGMIADNVFNNYSQFEGLPIVFGVLAFTIQIYCDFSGYSDIARGLCKLLGFDLMVNFRLPYFALNPTDFWQRWHISLSSWLRDYLYISLGGNRGGPVRTYRNLFLTMLLGGLWHGAAWPFVLWGAYHGLILCAYRVLDRRPEHRDPWSGRYPSWRIVGKMMLMFVLTMIGWAIFRSQSMEQLLYIVGHVGVGSWDFEMAYKLALFGLPVVLMDLAQYRSGDLLVVTKQNYLVQGLVYGVLITGIIVFGVRDSLEFIYFQF